MAYYLAFDGVDDYVIATAPADVIPTSSYVVNVRFKTSNVFQFDKKTFTRSNNSSSTMNVIIGQQNNGTCRAFVRGSNANFLFTPVLSNDTIYDVRVELNVLNGVISLYLDGLLVDSATDPQVQALRLTTRRFLGTESETSGHSLVDIYRVTETVDGTIENDYNPSSSNGTGSILPDDVGGNDGTLVNFTLPDAWVFYGAAGATYSITFDPATYTYTGADLSLLVSRSISFDEGNYSYSGVDLNLSASRNISLDEGNYAVTGNDISLLASRVLSFDSGSYAYTGNDLTLTYNPATGATYTLSFDAGNYLYTGNNLTTLANRKLTLDAGSYTYTGNDLTLTYTPATGATYFISLNAGSYVVSGNTINIAANRALLLDNGSYTLTGEPVTLATNRKLSLDAGSYAVTGNDADLIAHRSITLESGEYDYLGNPITLTYSGQIISLIDDYSVNYTNDFVTASYANNYINAEFK